MGVFVAILLVLTIGYVALFLLYRRGWDAVTEQKLDLNHNCNTHITVIVPARNEESNIKACIESILHQQYTGTFELVVVNDHSTDNTRAIVESFGSQLKLINLDEELASGAYKKKAIATAIAQSTGTLIVTTDADTSRGLLWLESIGQYFEKKQSQMIAAPVNYVQGKGWLNIFQVIDFLCMQGITAASLRYHFNSTCNGANLAYTRHAFNAVDGFNSIDHIASGDDMLLLHKIDQRFEHSVRFLKNSAAVVTTAAMPNLSSFIQQRVRWASKAKHYTDKRVTAVLAAVWLFNAMLLVQMVLVFHSLFSLSWCLAFLAIKIVVEQYLLRPVLQFYKQKELLLWHIILQPVHIVYIVACGLLGLVSTYQWKGRTVR
ncbi:MAG: hypothetical protein RL660_2599 [Bacteroidota bacterium]|jgi:cellulose synthase/poly-beta-1,6-N-acetylglucosamine synthase-like glycosyltransferase